MADEQSLLSSLFTLIEDVVFYGDRLGTGQLVSMMSPGQFLSQKLKENNPNDMFTQYDVTNDCLAASFIREPLLTTVSGVYGDVMDNVALPMKSLTQNQQNQLNADAAIMANLQDAYTKYQGIYQTASENYQAALFNTNVDPGTLSALKDARDRAENAFNTPVDIGNGNMVGLKQGYESAQGDFQYLQSGDPRSYWENVLKKNFHDALVSGATAKGNYYPTLFEPAITDWAGASWTHAVLDTSTVSSDSYSRSTAWSGGLGVSVGLWSFGGSGGHSETYQHQHSEVTNVSVDLEYLRVKIARPWLDTDVFTYRYWTWLKTHGFIYLSDGGDLSASPPVAPLGPRGMPFYPAEMLVVRNVKLTAAFTEQDNQVITSHTSASTSCGFACFSISGSYSEDTSEVKTSATFDGATISIDQPQIIAFLGTLLPRCPDPDPTLPWQGDGVFPSSITNEYSAELRILKNRAFAKRRVLVSNV
jgi:hypothetical protein